MRVRMVVVAAGLRHLMIGPVMRRVIVIVGMMADMRAMPRPFTKEIAQPGARRIRGVERNYEDEKE
ncbi:hypothetical protein MASR1M60_27140 [Rhodocyclaceae bacterium]